MEYEPILADFDNTWKEGLDVFLKEFIHFFLPAVYNEIDWNKGYESQEQELREIIPGGSANKNFVDKLFKVYRKDGEETWVYIHIEIQSQFDTNMPKRMYIYHCKLVSQQKMPLMSLIILGDENPNWRPERYQHEVLGSEVILKFQTVKLLDYKNRLEDIRASKNPFGFFVIAHLKTLETKKNLKKRFDYKEEITKELLEEGLSHKEAVDLFKLIDALMKLPKELEQDYIKTIRQYQEEKKMAFIAPFEELAMEKGRQEGSITEAQSSLTDILMVLFGELPDSLLNAIQNEQDVNRLRDLRKRAIKISSIEEFERTMNE